MRIRKTAALFLLSALMVLSLSTIGYTDNSGMNLENYRINCTSREVITNHAKHSTEKIAPKQIAYNAKKSSIGYHDLKVDETITNIPWRLAFMGKFIDTKGKKQARCEITVIGIAQHAGYPVNVKLKSGSTLANIKNIEHNANFLLDIIVYDRLVVHSTAKKQYYNIDITAGVKGKQKKPKAVLFPVLYNRMGRIYPLWMNPETGLIVPYPQLHWGITPLANRVKSDREQKKAFLRAHENSYYGGKIQTWLTWEVHHARPSKFGGTNAYSNLYPLPAFGNIKYGNIHARYSAWFQGY